jgi:hypothetical protein
MKADVTAAAPQEHHPEDFGRRPPFAARAAGLLQTE